MVVGGCTNAYLFLETDSLEMAAVDLEYIYSIEIICLHAWANVLLFYLRNERDSVFVRTL